MKSFVDIVTELALASDMDSPAEIAAEIYPQLSPPQVREGFQYLLTDYVRHLVTRPRPVTDDSMPSTSQTNGDPYRHVRRASAAAREWLAEWDQRVLGSEGWMKLGDATAEDCRAVADSRFRKAAANETVGRRYQAVADALVSAGVKTVSDLTPDQFHAVWP